MPAKLSSQQGSNSDQRQADSQGDASNNGHLHGSAENELRFGRVGSKQLDAMSFGHDLIELQRREHVPDRTSSDPQARFRLRRAHGRPQL